MSDEWLSLRVVADTKTEASLRGWIYFFDQSALAFLLAPEDALSVSRRSHVLDFKAARKCPSGKQGGPRSMSWSARCYSETNAVGLSVLFEMYEM